MFRWAGLVAVFGLLVAQGGGCRSTEETTATQQIEATDATGPGADTVLPEPAATGFAANAFPPTLSDSDWHRDAWLNDDCLRCHETGVQDAPRVVHQGLPEILLGAKCRSCHVAIPGSAPRDKEPQSAVELSFAANAFPPMIPGSGSHARAWTRDDCLLCHEDGIKGAPVVEHKGLPRIVIRAKCRTCHVQVRAVESGAME